MSEIVKSNIIYLGIPIKWNDTYYKLLYILASVGKDIVDDCNYMCKDAGKTIFNCWNLFQSAIAADRIGEVKKAEFIIDYINKQLALYITNNNIIVPECIVNYPNCVYELTDEGNYRFYLEVKKDGISYSTIVILPSTGEDYFYYGALETNDAEEVNIDYLQRASISSLGNNFDIETDLLKSYIWVVSTRQLVFKQGDYTVTLHSTQIGDLIYYNTDELLPGSHVINISELDTD